MITMLSAFRYYGGKTSLASWIIKHFPKHTVYVEPFGGSAAVLLNKARSPIEVYNDMDSNVVNAFRVLRDNPYPLIRAIHLTPFSKEEQSGSFKLSCDDPVELARRFLVKQMMSIGADTTTIKSGFRRVKNLKGSKPFDAWRDYPDLLLVVVERLRGVQIEHIDALEVIKKYDSPETLFYVDPPYVQETRNRGDRYQHDYSDSDHTKLYQVLKNVAGSVVLSGYESELYESYEESGWVKRKKKASTNGKSRNEVLWINNRLNQPALFIL